MPVPGVITSLPANSKHMSINDYIGCEKYIEDEYDLDFMDDSCMTDSSIWDDQFLSVSTHHNKIMIGSGESLCKPEDNWKVYNTFPRKKVKKQKCRQQRTKKLSWTDSDFSDSDNLSITTILDLTKSQSFACQVEPADLDQTPTSGTQPGRGQPILVSQQYLQQPMPTENFINSFLIRLCLFGLLGKLILVLTEYLLLPAWFYTK